MQSDETVSLPPMDPARAAYLRETITRLAGHLVARLLEPAASDPSTDSSSGLGLQERLAMRAARAALPTLQRLLMTQLSELDPTSLEIWMGASALALESLLEQAPGEPLPRHALAFDAGGNLMAVPLTMAAG